MKRSSQSKYGNLPTWQDNIRFASRREAKRYRDLKLLEIAGEIMNLELQVRYPLNVNGHRVCTWICDFHYFDMSKREAIFEDCKGYRTREYILKKKLFQAVYNKKILET